MQRFCGILLLLSIAPLADSAPILGNETDHLALQDFKSRVAGMSFWNDSVHFCDWVGVTCSRTSKRVTELNLQAQELVGSITPSLGNLTYLSVLRSGENNFSGRIPPELGRLLQLKHLNLPLNSLSGEIPGNLSHCTQLVNLNMGYNYLVGKIPDELKSLSKLYFLSLGHNNLTGKIPAWIGNFSALRILSLALNNFQGIIPMELGLLPSVQLLQFFENSLSGKLPDAIFNISSISYLSVSKNQLQGTIPPNVGITLPNIEIFAGDINHFTGAVPPSIGNASKLQVFSFSQNGFTGTLPPSIGNLQNLSRLDFDDNRLGKGLDFLNFLANCTNLDTLGIANNYFEGELPPSIANLSRKLRTLTLGSNLLNGLIPAGIGNLINLELLGLESNNLNGRVHDDFGRLENLVELYLNVNNLSGPIPSFIGNLSRLSRLYMEYNNFTGNIPSSLGYCQSLTALDLSHNKLTGTIPKEIFLLSSLSTYLALRENSLTGSLPEEVGKLQNLGSLDVSENKLSGPIPHSLGSCTSLVRLIMCGNEFERTIPQSFEDLRGLTKLDLSRNNLSGQVPEFLGKLIFLKNLNLSYNHFNGAMPEGGIFSNAAAISVVGNDQLCGGALELNLPICPPKETKFHKFPLLKVLVPVFSSIAVPVLLLSVLYLTVGRKRPRQRALASSTSRDIQFLISFSELNQATNGFTEDNMIGSGSFGSVYRGVLSRNEAVVAIKVLNLQQKGAFKSFMAEWNAMQNIRHRNLLKIITVCSSIDRHGNEFKALVFDFMSNGNLDQWLHRQCSKRLTFIQRLNIAIDVASAIDYLHNFCQTPIVHCDLKPSNVLLDGDMVAHVGDFGLAKFIFEKSNDPTDNQTMSNSLKGSIGYIPPEYGIGGKVSIVGDIYSYGILLLEMFTGKRPTDAMFKEGMDIHCFASRAFSNSVMEIVDPLLLCEVQQQPEEEGDDGKVEEEELRRESYVTHEMEEGSRMEEWLVTVMKLGLSCSSTSPMERLSMGIVINRMTDIKTSYMEFNKTKKKL